MAETKKLNISARELKEVIGQLEKGLPLAPKYRFLLFEDAKQVELVWKGKTQDVTRVVLPFQTIEVVDEPRKESDTTGMLPMFDERGRQVGGWTNKLIWGDNKFLLASLRDGSLRMEIDRAVGGGGGKINLYRSSF